MGDPKSRKSLGGANLNGGALSGGGGDIDDLGPGWVDRVRLALTDWYRRDGRDLPWRADRDPYRVLVSETMLVQTTVAAVVPYFARFLERFPDVGALAEANESDVLKAWEGLGYYRRARQLHEAAKRIVEEFDGRVPSDLESLQRLPGVGRYIAGAVASFAFDLPAPIIEANTQRVLSRWLAVETDLKSSATQARLWKAAARLVPETGAGEFNQAFMELGATLCTPKEPCCLVCPVSPDCRARIEGIQNQIPKTTPKAAPLLVAEAAALVEREGRFLVVRRPENGLWPGFWEFPTIHLEGANPALRLSRVHSESLNLADGVRLLTGVNVRIGSLAQTISYAVTRHKVRLDAFRGFPIDGGEARPPEAGETAWVDRKGLSALTFGSANRRLFPLLEEESLEAIDP